MYSFKEFLGNDGVKRQMQSAISSDKVSHAYIICGSLGMGKKQLAKTIAKTLECESGGSDACGHCVGCRAFDSGNHPDVLYVYPTKTKALGVDDIREQIVQQMEIKQYKYKYKIFIVDKADEMSIQAQNALLKTLEEPPYYGVIVLLAKNMDRFLPTILSRCVILKLRSVPKTLIKQYLIDNELANEEIANVYFEYAQGSIGQAIKIASSSEFVDMREDILDKISSITDKDLVSVMAMGKELEIYKENTSFLEIAYLWYRDLLVAKKMNDEAYLIQKDKTGLIFDKVINETEYGLSKKIDAVWNAKRQLSQNSNFQLTMEIMLMNIKEN